MEYNKNKIIFGVLGIIIFICFLFLFLTINNSGNESSSKSKYKDLNIWTIGPNMKDLNSFLNSFKERYPEYKNTNINLVNFLSYSDYIATLNSAFLKGIGPDIFMLNSSQEYSIFDDQILPLPQDIVNPNDFRKKYRVFFAQNLIKNFSSGDGNIEKLIGLPIGYETLGIFYNRRYTKSSDLDNISSLDNIIGILQSKNKSAIPIGLGNGTSVGESADIISQFLLLEGVKSISDFSKQKFKSALQKYFSYGDSGGFNGYDKKFNTSFLEEDYYDVKLFVNQDLLMIVGYPRIIQKINDQGGFPGKNFLEARAFPIYSFGNKDRLVNYNYFVINKNSSNLEIAYDFISFISSDIGASIYLKNLPYYFPALLSLESSVLNNKIDENYSITLSDFYDDSSNFVVFKKKIKDIFDEKIPLFLDDSINYIKNFETFSKFLSCRLEKVKDLSNLDVTCK